MKADAFPFNELMISELGRLGRYCNQALERAVADIGLTLQEFRIVGLLIGECGISQNELARKLSVRAATLSVAIDKLVDKGAIRRTIAPHDGRVKLLSLAPDLDMRQPLHILQQIENTLTAGMRKKDKALVLKTLERASRNLELALQK